MVEGRLIHAVILSQKSTRGDAFGECSEKDLHLSHVFGVSKARTGGAFLLRRVPFL